MRLLQAEHYARCSSLFVERHAAASFLERHGGFRWLAAWCQFAELHAKLSAAYELHLTRVKTDEQPEEAAEAADSHVAVSSAVWALLELCKLNVEVLCALLCTYFHYSPLASLLTARRCGHPLLVLILYSFPSRWAPRSFRV